MKTLIRYLLFFSITYISCSTHSEDLQTTTQKTNELSPLPCQKVSIELNLQDRTYRAPFNCYEWQDWQNGLNIKPSKNENTLLLEFPNLRICKPIFKFCAEEICECQWQPIEDCPRNNVLTLHLDTCLKSQTNLFLETYLIENE